MTELTGMTPQELSDWCKAQGMPAFRGKQIFRWIHQGADFDAMTNLPAAMRAQLKEIAVAQPVSIIDERKSQIDDTVKFLFGLKDGNCVEGVLMHYHHGYTLCISTQVGCRMGCRFCASTLDGLERGLKPSEMLDQIYQIQKWSKERVHNVVVMGTGEPLDNYDALLRFIHLLTCEGGLHISQRNLTVSTCGIVPNMRRLADEKLQITLALSLHASSQEKRKTLMPVANKYELSEVLDACRYYFSQTGRRITFEYSLVGGVNDSEEDARELTELVKDINCHINLIPVNPIKERDYVQSDTGAIQRFKNKLEKSGINVTIRREMGRDIDGACGQLRKRHLDEMGGEDSSC